MLQQSLVSTLALPGEDPWQNSRLQQRGCGNPESALTSSSHVPNQDPRTIEGDYPQLENVE